MLGDVAPLSSLLVIPTAGSASVSAAYRKDSSQVGARRSPPRLCFPNSPLWCLPPLSLFTAPISVLSIWALFLFKLGTDKARGKFGKANPTSQAKCVQGVFNITLLDQRAGGKAIALNEIETIYPKMLTGMGQTSRSPFVLLGFLLFCQLLGLLSCP